MIWGFVWRFVLLAVLLAGAATFLVGFALKLADADPQTTYQVGTAVQVAAFLVAAAVAFRDARIARTR